MEPEVPREVPIHIDTSDVFGEAVVVFIAIFVVCMTLRVLVGSQEDGVLLCFAVAVAGAIYFFKHRVGKNDGYLIHHLSRNWGVKLQGILPNSLKKIRR
jgi:hypothetical protein